MPKIYDLSGMVFDGITIIKSTGTSDPAGGTIWLCRCHACGENFTRNTNGIKFGSNKSCGCLKRLDGGEGNFRNLYRTYQRGAKKRDIGFYLAIEEFRELVEKPCFYCGVEPKQVYTSPRSNGAYVHNGVDRVNSAKDYTVDNCVPCCKKCNIAKGSMTLLEFSNWLSLIYSNRENWFVAH